MIWKIIKDIWKGFGRKRGMEKWCNYIYDIKSKRNYNNNHKPMWPTTSKKKLFSPERKISNGKCFSWTSQHFANTFEQFWHGEKQYVIAGGEGEKY